MSLTHRVMRAGLAVSLLRPQHDDRCTNRPWDRHGRHGVSLSQASFAPDSSKELEELRSAFTRALEYLKQEVEERKCGSDPCFVPLYFLLWVELPVQAKALGL